MRFALLSARDAAERMASLERFLVFWYGTARPEYGFSEAQLSVLALPAPLHQFYRFAGRWPTPNLRPYLHTFDAEEEGYFYTGTSGHHLCDPGTLTDTADGRVVFFWESSGNWQLLTLPTGDDPPVWRREEGTETLLPVTLSELLVTHCLMTTLYEEPNAAWSTPVHCAKYAADDALSCVCSGDRARCGVLKPSCPITAAPTCCGKETFWCIGLRLSITLLPLIRREWTIYAVSQPETASRKPHTMVLDLPP